MGAAETAIYGGSAPNATGAAAYSATLDQVPGIAVEILEHRHRAIGFVPGLFAENHSLFQHRAVVACEIVCLQEEEDPPAGLPADRRFLIGIRGAGEQQRRRTLALRRHDNPALVAAELCIFDKGEAELSRVEVDRLVVVAHEDRDEGNPPCRHCALTA